MPPRLTPRAVLARAWTDTIRVKQPREIAISVAVVALSLFLQRRWAGRALVTDQLHPAIASLAALGLVFIVLLFLNLIAAPARIAMDGWKNSEKQQLEAETELQALKGRQPTIKTRVESNAIVVHNSGANAEFRAQIRILKQWNYSGPQEGRVLQGFWSHALGPRAPIFVGLEDRLMLWEINPSHGYVPPTASLDLYCYDPEVGGKQIAVQRPFWIESEQPADFGLILEVTISSDPAMLGGKLVQAYRFTREGLTEQN